MTGAAGSSRGPTCFPARPHRLPVVSVDGLREIHRHRLDQSPCCLNILDFKDETRARLMLSNDVSHYEEMAAKREGSLSKWWDGSGQEPRG